MRPFLPRAKARGSLAALTRWLEADAWSALLRFVHELLDGQEDHLEVLVVLPFECAELAGELFVGGKHLSKADEGANDLDAHPDGALAAKDRGEHRHALLGEGVRWTAPAAPT